MTLLTLSVIKCTEWSSANNCTSMLTNMVLEKGLGKLSSGRTLMNLQV